MKKLIRAKGTEFEQNGADLVIIDTAQRGARPIMVDSHVLDEAFKCGDEDALNIITVDVNNQELTVMPTAEKQVLLPDEGYTGFSPVTVNPAPLEDITITPTKEFQHFNHENTFGYDKVTVNAVKTEELEITPTTEAQEFIPTDSLGYDKVTVAAAPLQSRAVTPSKNTQTIKPTANYYGIRQVTVNPIPSSYIVPSGTITITTNGTHDVTNYASVKTNITSKPVGEKTITANGVYDAQNDGYEGYSVVTVNTPGLSDDQIFKQKLTGYGYLNDVKVLLKYVPDLDLSAVSNTLDSCFKNCEYLESVGNLDTRNAKIMSNLFNNCRSLTSIGSINTSNATDVNHMFYYCQKLTTIPTLDLSKATDVSYLFYGCSALTTIPQLSFPAATNASQIFSSSGVVTLPDLSFPNVTTFTQPFYSANKLVTFPKISAPKLTRLSHIFQRNESLVDISNFQYLIDSCKDVLTEIGDNGDECPKLDVTTCPTLNIYNVTSLNSFFYSADIKQGFEMDTSKVTNAQAMYSNCMEILSVPEYNLGSATQFGSLLWNNKKLVTCGGFVDLGKSCNSSPSNYNKLSLQNNVNMTADSIMNILNKLYDLTTKSNGYSYQIQLGTTLLNKLTAEQIAVATDKGWTIS